MKFVPPSQGYGGTGEMINNQVQQIETLTEQLDDFRLGKEEKYPFTR